MTASQTPEPALQPPATPAGRRLLVAALAAALCLGLPACGESEEPLHVLPINADITLTAPITDDPGVFFAKVAVPPGLIAPDTVRLAVMLRTTLTTYAIDSINLEITFDPEVVQVLGPDLTLTPFGACGGPAPCDPDLCQANTGAANTSGDLLISINRNNDPACTSFAAITTGTTYPDIPMANDAVRILTFDVRGATVGSSPIDLLTSSGAGDCEILQWDPGPTGVIEHPFTFNDGGAVLTATR